MTDPLEPTKTIAKFVIADGRIERSDEGDLWMTHPELLAKLVGEGRPPPDYVAGLVLQRGSRYEVLTHADSIPSAEVDSVNQLLAQAFAEVVPPPEIDSAEWTFE